MPSAGAQADQRHRSAAAAMLAAGMLLLLVASFEVSTHLLRPDALQVIASSQADGHTLASRTITDAQTVADLYGRINALPPAQGLAFHCALTGPGAVRFTFRFTRLSVPIETASHPGDGCWVWWLSSGGIREPYPREDPTGEWLSIMQEIQPLPCPTEWQPACDGY